MKKMPPKTNSRENASDEAAQDSAFISAAREHGCDESPDAFDAIVKQIAAAPPTDNAAVKKNAGKRRKPKSV